jgi:hypothetical protein
MVLFILLNIGTFLDVVFILLLVYYGFKLFMRFYGPRIVENAADKIYRDIKAREEASRGTENNPPGKVTVERNERREKSTRRSDGEYVDFEEVK